MKTCSKCGETKKLTDFYADAREKDGLRHACKACIRSARKTSYLANHTVELERSREWKKRNVARRLDYNATWRAAHPDKVSQHTRKWQRANPGKCAEIKARRRASGACPWANKEKIAEIYQFARELRDAGLDVHVDHIIPLKGKNVSGLHVERNLRVCLATANLRKGNRHMENQQ
ncbi:MAG TPA: hypothetical protein PKD55_23015 [Bellilinea sp.]|nr:hypothetical protein [Bellilinea sp.]